MAKKSNIKINISQNQIELQSDKRKEINHLISYYNKSSEIAFTKPMISLNTLFQKIKTYNTKYCQFNNLQLVQKSNNCSYLMCKKLCKILAIDGFKDFRLKSICNYFVYLTQCSYIELNEIVRQMYDILDKYYLQNQIFNAPMTVRFISVCITKYLLKDNATTSHFCKYSLEAHLAKMESELEMDIKTFDNYKEIEITLIKHFKKNFKKLSSKESLLIYLSQTINKRYENKIKIRKK